jgi:hypothetical protein
MIKFTEYFQLYNQPQEIRANCNQLTVINIGTSIAILEGLEIQPGDQYISPGNENEFNETRYRISFNNLGTNIVLAIRKTYR